MRLMRLVVGVLLGVLLVPDSAKAQSIPSDWTEKLDSYVNEAMTSWNIPGLSLAVVRDGEIAYMQGYGKADASGRPITPQTPFWLASVSKSITATAIMQLADAGQIDLDAPVQTMIPWFREGMNDSVPITVRHLLHQNSGFSRISGNELLSNGDQSDDALENNVRRLSAVPLLFEPGSRFEYSNSNYDVLGYLVQVVSGQSYEDYIEEHIFTPLGMTHSYTRLAEAEGIAEGFYNYFGSPTPFPIPHSRAVTPSAGLISSAEDLTRYVIAHLNDGVYEEVVLVSPESTAMLHAPGAQISLWDSYAMGWFRSPVWEAVNLSAEGDSYSLPTKVQHDGGWPNFRAFLTLIPSENLGVITLMNTAAFAYDSALYGVANNIALLAMGHEPTPVTVFEDTFTQNSLWIVIALNIIWIVRLISALLTMQRWWSKPESRPRTLPQIALKVVLPALFDVLMLVYIFVVAPMQFSTPLHTIFGMNYDRGLLIRLMLALAGGWGLIRTVLYILLLTRRAKPAPQLSPAGAL
jgi:CubicO group peptidase (beta-lactamase class C family)